ncbi:hypothetical protein K490DRAFT_31612, partial [Saccharata proteae CBS 121410]
SHPVHPATVHFPIAFWSLAWASDAVHLLASNPSTSSLVAGVFAPFGIELSSSMVADVSRLSHYSNIFGILACIPAVLSGGAELYAMISSQGLYEKGLNPKVEITLLHAGLNDLAFAAALGQWRMRRNVPDYAPTGAQALISMAMLPSLFFSAYLGGKLVYEYGVGVMRQGEATKIKQNMQKDELKKKDGQTQVKERKGE